MLPDGIAFDTLLIYLLLSLAELIDSPVYIIS